MRRRQKRHHRMQKRKVLTDGVGGGGYIHIYHISRRRPVASSPDSRSQNDLSCVDGTSNGTSDGASCKY
jgi:hypothetical protein